MEPLVDLGRALARLRHLYGLSRAECAARLEIPHERLAAMESGTIKPNDLAGMAALYELDEDALHEGIIRPEKRPVEGLTAATVFLLQGDYQDFDARALDALDRAMRAARAKTADASSTTEGRERLRQRLQFVPTAPAGPNPADAARQGYKLARMVRARLHLGDEPIDDMRALLEDRLGIVVLVDDLVGPDLRAASVLDTHRAAAAAILASGHPYLNENRMLARVYLAHELCHVLFDPGLAGSVRLALDGPSGGSGSAKTGTGLLGLLESRAKGFAAELLIPLGGVTEKHGAPAAVRSLGIARNMVAQVREYFGTPWEVATSHLCNLGFLSRELRLDLLEEERVPASWRPALLHPIERMLAPRAALETRAAKGAARTAGDAAIPHDAPPHVREARDAAEAALDALNEQVIAAATEAVERGRVIQATVTLGEHFDDLFRAGEFEAARRALMTLDPNRLPPRVLTGVLMVTRYAREHLGQSRIDFLARVQRALANKWALPADDIAEITGRLG